ASSTRSGKLGHVESGFHSARVAVSYLGKDPPERLAPNGVLIEKDPDNRRAHCGSVSGRHDAAGPASQRDAEARANGGTADAPGQSAEPSQECAAEVAHAALEVVGMSREALRHEGGLLGIVRDEPGPAEQLEPLDAPEPARDRPGRHPF